MELRAEALGRRYLRRQKSSNTFYAVRGAELALTGGSLIAVTGRSGSGKSTLLNLLAGLLEPTEGKVWLDQTDLYAMEDKERAKLRNAHFGIIPQGQSGLSSLNVLENVLLPARLYDADWKRHEEEKKERARKLLAHVGIDGLADAFPRELSGGELRRMAIARALLPSPGILLADEPTGDLDDENTATVLALLRAAADDGAAVLLVTHENEAEKYADAVYRMSEGILQLK